MVNGYIGDVFAELITDWISSLIDKILVFLNDVFLLAKTAVESELTNKITDYSFKLGISILIFMAISQIIRLYLLSESGEPEMDMVGFFIRLGKTAILMSCSTFICTFISKLTDFIAKDVLSISEGKVGVGDVLKSSCSTVGTGADAIILILLIILVLVYLIIIIFQAGIRGVNLAILQMVAPLFAVNYITADKGLWNKWLQTLISVSLTYVMQLIMVSAGLKHIAAGIQNINSILIGVAWLIVAVQTPRILKEFAYSTEIGKSFGHAAGAISVARRVIGK